MWRGTTYIVSDRTCVFMNFFLSRVHAYLHEKSTIIVSINEANSGRLERDLQFKRRGARTYFAELYKV